MMTATTPFFKQGTTALLCDLVYVFRGEKPVRTKGILQLWRISTSIWQLFPAEMMRGSIGYTTYWVYL